MFTNSCTKGTIRLFDSAYLGCLFLKLKDVQQSILFTLENIPILFPLDLKSISKWNVLKAFYCVKLGN